uniref:Uncharacterized protein n=1 Tax=Octopus bimaculoides TaxID=37653 RepID=A0A0L8FT13_OCTBM
MELLNINLAHTDLTLSLTITQLTPLKSTTAGSILIEQIYYFNMLSSLFIYHCFLFIKILSLFLYQADEEGHWSDF